MKFSVYRDELLKSLQAISGVVERRQALPVLANALFNIKGNHLTLTTTDMEVEMVSECAVVSEQEGAITLPARKLLDIVKALPEGSTLKFARKELRMAIQCGRSRFQLSCLEASEFPLTEEPVGSVELVFSDAGLKRLLDRTHFAMAQQDVRYFLNGLMLHAHKGGLRAVATDGHRLALCDAVDGVKSDGAFDQIIVPRKAVTELSRLLDGSDREVRLALASRSMRVLLDGLRITTKLVDGRFPDYENVIPDFNETGHEITADRDSLRQSLARASILANDKYRAIRLVFESGLLRLSAHNPEQEEAEVELEVDYEGGGVEIGFNVGYLIDALSVLNTERVRIFLKDENSSCLLLPSDNEQCRYVVMPMRL